MAKKAEKKNMVVLSNPELGEQPFKREVAERILANDVQKKRVTWTLHDNKLTFENGKIISKSGN